MHAHMFRWWLLVAVCCSLLFASFLLFLVFSPRPSVSGMHPSLCRKEGGFAVTVLAFGRVHGILLFFFFKSCLDLLFFDFVFSDGCVFHTG